MSQAGDETEGGPLASIATPADPAPADTKAKIDPKFEEKRDVAQLVFAAIGGASLGYLFCGWRCAVIGAPIATTLQQGAIDYWRTGEVDVKRALSEGGNLFRVAERLIDVIDVVPE